MMSNAEAEGSMRSTRELKCASWSPRQPREPVWQGAVGAVIRNSTIFGSIFLSEVPPTLDTIGRYIANDSPAALKNTIKTPFLLNATVP
jgi:hypothetical protein